MAKSGFKTISFRSELVSKINDFLHDEKMSCEHTRDALIELAISLPGYREEGLPLFPQVFICDELETMLSVLQGREHIRIGVGPRSRETMRLALKQCAPLAQGGWAIYVHRHKKEFAYGLFRVGSLPLSLSPKESLDPSIHVIVASQLAENAVELVGSGGHCLHAHMSDARDDDPSPANAVEDLVSAITEEAPAGQREQAASFMRRNLFQTLQHPHGTLAAVIAKGKKPPNLFKDGIILDPPIDILRRILEYGKKQDDETAIALQSVGDLLGGMLRSDGITLFSSNCQILGYNVFIELPEPKSGPRTRGGSRRRTFEKLCSEVGGTVVAAFYRSTDGVSGECRRKKS